MPGCSCATGIAKVLIITLLRQNVVDDITLQSAGSHDLASQQLQQGFGMLYQGITDRRLLLSIPKTVFMASDDQLKEKASHSQRGIKRQITILLVRVPGLPI